MDFVIDAIFGTGFSGNVTGIYKEAVDFINNIEAKKISIDIPSGINADNGYVANVAVKADLVITMGCKKIGLVIGKSVDYIKDLKVVDISIPKFLTEYSGLNTFLI